MLGLGHDILQKIDTQDTLEIVVNADLGDEGGIFPVTALVARILGRASGRPEHGRALALVLLLLLPVVALLLPLALVPPPLALLLPPRRLALLLPLVPLLLLLAQRAVDVLVVELLAGVVVRERLLVHFARFPVLLVLQRGAGVVVGCPPARRLTPLLHNLLLLLAQQLPLLPPRVLPLPPVLLPRPHSARVSLVVAAAVYVAVAVAVPGDRVALAEQIHRGDQSQLVLARREYGRDPIELVPPGRRGRFGPAAGVGEQRVEVVGGEAGQGSRLFPVHVQILEEKGDLGGDFPRALGLRLEHADRVVLGSLVARRHPPLLVDQLQIVVQLVDGDRLFRFLGSLGALVPIATALLQLGRHLAHRGGRVQPLILKGEHLVISRLMIPPPLQQRPLVAPPHGRGEVVHLEATSDHFVVVVVVIVVVVVVVTVAAGGDATRVVAIFVRGELVIANVEEPREEVGERFPPLPHQTVQHLGLLVGQRSGYRPILRPRLPSQLRLLSLARCQARDRLLQHVQLVLTLSRLAPPPLLPRLLPGGAHTTPPALPVLAHQFLLHQLLGRDHVQLFRLLLLRVPLPLRFLD